MRKIKLFILVLLVLATGIANTVVAQNYKTVDSLPNEINGIKEGEWDNGRFDSSISIPFKYNSDGLAVFCTMLQNSVGYGPCSLRSSDWDEPVKAGVAAIIQKADVSNSNMTEDYYYAEEAINYFLYEKVDGDAYHLPYYGNYGYNEIEKFNDKAQTFYNIAETEYNRVKNLLDNKDNLVNLKIKDVTTPSDVVKFDSGNFEKVVRKFEFDGNIGDDDKISVSYRISGENSDKVKVKINGQYAESENGEIGEFRKNDTFTVEVEPKDAVDYTNVNFMVHVVVTAEVKTTYSVAEKYYCGSDSVQSYTPNSISPKTINDKSSKRFSVTNTSIPTLKLKIVKIDQDTKEELPGAIFKLTDPDDESEITLETGDDGTVEVSNLLKDKEYCISEVTAPSGYIANKDDNRCFKIELKDNKYIYTPTSGTDSFTSIDDEKFSTTYSNRKSKIKILKVDKNGKPVSGAKMMLVSELVVKTERINHPNKKIDEILLDLGKDDKVVEGTRIIWDTEDTAKTFESLPVGFYYIVELETPEGYAKNRKIFKHIVINSATEDGREFQIENRKIVVSISKVDITTKEEVPGAHLQLFDDQNKLVDEWDSIADAHQIEGLKPGKYTLKETIAPEGYELSSETVEFTIDEYGIVDETSKNGTFVIMTNEHTKVYISKQDITTKEELPGATLKLLDESGNVVRLNGKELIWVSENEPHYIEGLPANRTYTLVEETAPDGYSLNTESVTFTISEDGTIIGDTVMYNTPIPDIPNTLSTKSILITLGGVIIISLGIGLYLNGIKKKDQI